MALNWQLVTNFNDNFYEFLKKIEAPNQSDRFNIHMVDGNPTIGVGFDLKAGSDRVQRIVLKAMGFNGGIVDLVIDKGKVPTAGTGDKIEYDYVVKLKSLMDKGGSAADINKVMLDRKNDLSAIYATFISQKDRRSSFTFSTEQEVRDTFDKLWPLYRDDLLLKLPALTNDTVFHTSKEMMALGFIVWNGGAGIIGAGIKNAIDNGDRAKAWFELRYKSNGGTSSGTVGGGIAKGRFFQSQLFGLYDDINNVDFGIFHD